MKRENPVEVVARAPADDSYPFLERFPGHARKTGTKQGSLVSSFCKALQNLSDMNLSPPGLGVGHILPVNCQYPQVGPVYGWRALRIAEVSGKSKPGLDALRKMDMACWSWGLFLVQASNRASKSCRRFCR